MKHEAIIRLGVFAGVFVLMALWEFAGPRRAPALRRTRRWPSNLALVVVDTILLRVLFPAGAVGVAWWAESRGWGALAQFEMPTLLAAVVTVLVLDFVIYGQHWLFHKVPWLWRLHRMHHADLDVDVTTGTRFHPLEILVSMLIKSAVIIALGASPVGVLAFEVLLNATSMFNHSNVRLAPPLDRLLRCITVTPDMHRVHHSILRHETDSNFGFNLPWWDRLFRTYRAQPEAGHDGVTLGLPQFRDPKELRLDRMLLQPFRGDGKE